MPHLAAVKKPGAQRNESGKLRRQCSTFRLRCVIEIMKFRLAPGGDEAEFLAADRRVQEEFAYQQAGLLRRTTARGEDGGWIVIDVWRSAADAHACASRWDRDPVAQAFMALLDGSSVSVQRYMTLD